MTDSILQKMWKVAHNMIKNNTIKALRRKNISTEKYEAISKFHLYVSEDQGGEKRDEGRKILKK